ncbi:MAG: hypothetical protein H7A40_01850 [Chlamydiales bacterium]|nr:hypothetical protein [Chlamydiales bacterium]
MINYLTKPMQTANSYFDIHHLKQPRRMRSGLTEVVTEVVQSGSRAHTFLAGGAAL